MFAFKLGHSQRPRDQSLREKGSAPYSGLMQSQDLMKYSRAYLRFSCDQEISC